MSNQIGEIIIGTETEPAGDKEPEPSGRALRTHYYNEFSGLFQLIDDGDQEIAPLYDDGKIEVQLRSVRHERGLGFRALLSSELMDKYRALSHHQRQHATDRALWQMDDDYQKRTGVTGQSSGVESSSLLLFEPSSDAYTLGQWVDDNQTPLWQLDEVGRHEVLRPRFLFETHHDANALSQRELPTLLSQRLLLGGVALFAETIEESYSKLTA